MNKIIFLVFVTLSSYSLAYSENTATSKAACNKWNPEEGYLKPLNWQSSSVRNGGGYIRTDSQHSYTSVAKYFNLVVSAEYDKRSDGYSISEVADSIYNTWNDYVESSNSPYPTNIYRPEYIKEQNLYAMLLTNLMMDEGRLILVKHVNPNTIVACHYLINFRAKMNY